MKKMIMFPYCEWAERLITVARAREIAYFLTDEDVDGNPKIQLLNREYPIYGLDHIEGEDIEDIIVLVTDSKKYGKYKQSLELYNLKENIHFFNGWKLEKSFYSTCGGANNWIEYENASRISLDNQESWERRAEAMSKMIPYQDVGSVMDIGCGNCRLKKYLPDNIIYYGLDYVARNSETLVCDINRQPLPDVQADMYYLAGVIMYVDDVAGLFRQMKRGKYILLNYMDEMGNIRLDNGMADINAFLINRRPDYLSMAEIINALVESGYRIEHMEHNFRELNQYYILARNNLDY